MEIENPYPMDRARIEAYLASHAGNDGGNPSSGLWICGIEFGGDFDPPEAGSQPELEPNHWSEEHLKRYPDSVKAQYHQKAAKFLVALEQIRQDPSRRPILDGWRDYVANRLYTRGGASFKLNLFPFSSPTVKASGWWEAYGTRFCFKNKGEYFEACRELRFKFLRENRDKYNPRIILGTGKTHLKDFASAFGFKSAESQSVRLSGGGSTRECYLLRQNASTMVVCPFFGGRYGINSDVLILELAKLVSSEEKRLLG